MHIQTRYIHNCQFHLFICSHMSSGLISPSDFPDSPSQTIPQSPRRLSVRITPPPVPDQVNTFVVENTPAQFSCATSLSNLSLDDEPKIATDCLIKEMRLMNHPSDDRDDDAADLCDEISGLNINESHRAVTVNTSANESERNLSVDSNAFSDSDESARDSLLLEQCMSRGMNSELTSQNNNNEPPPLPPRNVAPRPSESSPENQSKHVSNSRDAAPRYAHDDSYSSEGSEAENDDILEQCIQNGMEKSTKPTKPIVAQRTTIPMVNDGILPSKLIKENPIGMFRHGDSFGMMAAQDETIRHQQEGTPCNFSVMSALSDLTVDSHVAGLVNSNR